MEKPSYYTTLTADVRFDNRLTPLAKILYAEITALSNSKTECYANNSYFAELFDVKERTISRTIKQLTECGYICVETKDKKRFIARVDKNVLYEDKNVQKVGQKCPDRVDKNVYQNNTSISIQDNIEKEIYKERENADYNYFVKAWNEGLAVNCYNMPKIATFGPERQKKLDELVNAVKPAMKLLETKETKPERFILKTIQKEYNLSDYLSGKTKKGVIGVDFVLTTEYFMKLLEGFYRTEQN